MKQIKIWVSDETFQKIIREKTDRFPGRLWQESNGSGSKPQFRFEAYRRSMRKKPQPLLILGHGWLKKSARCYQIKVSIPDRLGEMRASNAMRSECNEASDFLAGLDQLLNNI